MDVSVFATGSDWDASTLAEVRATGVRFVLPPASLRSSRKLSALYCRLAWPLLIPRAANSLYCIGPGRSHLLMHRLLSQRVPSINHEIVEPPSADSLAGRCASELDFTVANSAKVADLMRGFWPEKPIRVIPFLTSDHPMPPPEPKQAAGARSLRVVYLGRLVEQKRPDQLVRRWQHLCAHSGIGSARLDIHGYDPTGQMLNDLRGFVTQNGLADTVKIHGEYKLVDLPRILGESDLVVLPSLWEGLPLVLVEAMVRGVPFVATAAGGTEELGRDNPDVEVTSTDWPDFEAGLVRMAKRVRAGDVDSVRLHSWAEQRYGYDAVSKKWVDCLSSPGTFFSLS